MIWISRIKMAGLLFIIWYMLRDLPETSKGGFWHYFWPVYAAGALGMAYLEYAWWRMGRP